MGDHGNSRQGAVVETVGERGTETVVRGRPGRRTVEGRRQDAMDGVAEALRGGSGKTARKWDSSARCSSCGTS